MAIQEHEPLSAEPELMSAEKRVWCAKMWDKRGIKQPNIAVFHYAMNSETRPTAPNETIAFGFMNNNKFHDREPEQVITAIEKVDPGFFESYPRRSTTTYDEAFKKAAVSEMARAFYRHGLSAYGKPGLRKDQPGSNQNSPLAAI